MKWFHRRRLEHLADKLVGEGPYVKIGPVPAHKFDMQYVFARERGAESINQAAFNPRKCNTAACALGWAVSDPWFFKKGTLDYMGPDFWGLSSIQYYTIFIFSSYDNGRFVEAGVVAERLREAARTG